MSAAYTRRLKLRTTSIATSEGTPPRCCASFSRNRCNSHKLHDMMPTVKCPTCESRSVYDITDAVILEWLDNRGHPTLLSFCSVSFLARLIPIECGGFVCTAKHVSLMNPRLEFPEHGLILCLPTHSLDNTCKRSRCFRVTCLVDNYTPRMLSSCGLSPIFRSIRTPAP